MWHRTFATRHSTFGSGTCCGSWRTAETVPRVRRRARATGWYPALARRI